MPVATRRQRNIPNIWPGFVDALSSLLIIVIFLLMVFTLAQYFLSEALSGRDAALERLNRTVAELQEMLALEKATSEELRANIAQLSGDLQASVTARDQLSSQLAALLPERDALQRALTERTAALTAMTERATDAEERARRVEQDLADAFKTIEADREAIEVKLAEIASLMSDLEALRTVRAELETKVAQLAQSLQLNKDELVELTARYKAGQLELTAISGKYEETRKQLTELTDKFEASRNELAAATEKYMTSQKALEEQTARADRGESALTNLNVRLEGSEAEAARLALERNAAQQELTAVRDRTNELVAKLSTEEERTALAQMEIEQKEIRLKEALARSGNLEGKLTEEQRLSAAAQQQVQILNQQVAALRQQLARIEKALEISEAESEKQKVQVADLGRRLNMALASKVEELSRYRSEFFGRLREVVGDRNDIRVVGDRFVFQSEVLFDSGSAELSPLGREKIARLGETLLEIAESIPKDLNWVLRVDGHTDRVPIHTPRFPSNWELSSQRAISVVKFMMDLGVPPERLVAAGFGEFQPIDGGNDEIAYRRNRRIEFKLTER